MTQPTLPVVILADEVTTGQLQVSWEAFDAFCLQMEEALAELEQKWRPLAAPAASKIVRITKR